MTTSAWKSKSPQETRRIAKKFAGQLRRGDVVGFVGPLGSGKTLFIKGLCEGLGIDPEEVLSPTFTLIHHYHGKFPVYHFDVYRIESHREFEDLGYEEQFYGDGISLVEWADKIYKFLPQGSHVIEFKMVGDKERLMRCHRKGGE